IVEDENVVILVERDRTQNLTRPFFRFRQVSRFRRIEPERRDAHRLACLQPILAVDPLAVDAQLAFADHALDVGERQRRKPRFQKAVDPHSGFIGRDGDGLDLGCFRRERGRRGDLPHWQWPCRTWRSRTRFGLAKWRRGGPALRSNPRSHRRPHVAASIAMSLAIIPLAIMITRACNLPPASGLPRPPAMVFQGLLLSGETYRLTE